LDNKNGKNWVEGLKRLMKKKKVNQKELSQKSKVPEPTISDWLNGKSEPKIVGFANVAKSFDVSIDYLYGNDDCEHRENEEICKKTGLSETALEKLIKVKKMKFDRETGIDWERRLYVLNFLIENMEDLKLLGHLYNYLFVSYSTDDKDTLLGNLQVMTYDHTGKKKPRLIDARNIEHMYFTILQHHLMNLKDDLNKKKEAEIQKKSRKRGAIK